jgi:hypothetical protein
MYVFVPPPPAWKRRCTFPPLLSGLDLARRASALLASASTHRIRIRVLALHIKHAMARKIEWVVGVLQVLPALVYTLVHPRFGHRQSCACPSVPCGTRACRSESRKTTRALARLHPFRKLSPIVGDRVLHATFARRQRGLVKRVPPSPFVVSMLGLALAWAGGVLEVRGEGHGEGGVGERVYARRGGGAACRTARCAKHAIYMEAELLARYSI